MIKIVCVGKLKEKAITLLVDDYLRRIVPYSKIVIEELKDYPNFDDEASNRITIEKESKMILDKVSNDDYVVLLDLRGKYYSSVEISHVIDQASTYGSKNIVFIIGGSLGVDELPTFFPQAGQNFAPSSTLPPQFSHAFALKA